MMMNERVEGLIENNGFLEFKLFFGDIFEI
jgi:hypothetical protein